jgi:predicted lipoprotein with Yx(FWY)xxD motif
MVAAACGSGGATPATSTTVAPGSSGPSATPATVTVASVGSLGPALVNASGRTLYRFTQDSIGSSACTGTCASVWTPLTVPAGTTHVVAGTGVDTADLGTITRADGSHQVTYKGMPLYTYTGDTRAGVASGQGIGGTWFVVTTSSRPAATGTSSPPTTTAKSSGGYGY